MLIIANEINKNPFFTLILNLELVRFPSHRIQRLPFSLKFYNILKEILYILFSRKNLLHEILEIPIRD